MKIRFGKATFAHKEVVFSWLEEPHVKEFWDNSPEHKSDILNFMEGREKPSSYHGGLYSYWVGFFDTKPYCLIMSLQEKEIYNLPVIKKAHLSQQGHTYSLDYMIGSKRHLGRGLGAKTLEAFCNFIKSHYDKQADTFFIDPDENNPKARHVYEKAGFSYIGDFTMEGNGPFAGRNTHFLVKKL